jgi:hypothetical protein
VWGGRIPGIDFSPHSQFKNTVSDFQLNLTHPTDTTNMVEGSNKILRTVLEFLNNPLGLGTE